MSNTSIPTDNSERRDIGGVLDLWGQVFRWAHSDNRCLDVLLYVDEERDFQVVAALSGGGRRWEGCAATAPEAIRLLADQIDLNCS